MRVLIWSQHLLGTGHLSRSERLAAALASAGASVTLANGGEAPPPGSGAYRRVDLPSIRAADARFSALLDAAGAVVTEALWQARAAILGALIAEPIDAFVAELYPFGRRAFAREVEPVLATLHACRPRPVCVVSVRDVLVTGRRPGRAEEAVARVGRHFDRVLVHGDPRLIAFDASFPLAREVGDRLVYTGYIAPEIAPPRPPPRGVLVSAGGGAVGDRLLQAAIEAARRLGAEAGPWTLVAGRQAPAEDLARLAAGLPPGATLHHHVDDLPERMAAAALSVSRAGYNTVAELLVAGRPAVLVPFAEPGETEQAQRARALAAAGVAIVLAETELTGVRLAAAVNAALALPARRLDLDLDGARAAARLIRDLVERRS